MKRAAICVPDPWNYIDQYSDYSLMILNPAVSPERTRYLLDAADWSVLVTPNGEEYRNGNDYDDEKLFWYSSGTTGDSKFFSISQDKIDHVCSRLIEDYNITANDRYVSVMPLWHGHGQMFYWLSKRVGFEINFLPISKLGQMSDFDPTFITALPDILKVLAKLDFKSLRFVRSASSALPDTVFDQLKQKFNVPVIESFGMTEASSHCFTNPLYGEQRVGTVGLPTGIKAEIRDQHLWIRGPAVYKPEWIDTGDLAEIDEKGYYKILGRARDTLNIRGYKINPISIEQQLMRKFSHMTGCVIFGTNKLKCLYTGQVNVDAVSKFLVEISSFCKPSFIQQVEKIPVNGMGKVSRSMLNQDFQ